MENRFLTDDEIIELTRSVQPSKQCEVLSNAGMAFIKDREGRPHLTWRYVETFLAGEKILNEPERDESPNFDAI